MEGTGTSKDQGDEKRNQEQSPRQEQEKREAPGPSFLRRKVTKSKGLRATELIKHLIHKHANLI